MQIVPFRLDSDVVVLTAFEAAERALELMPTDTGTFRQVDDATLVDLVRRASALRDRVATLGAILAGEVARRSAPELGSAGLAQRTGFRTPTELVKVTSGATGPEAVAAIRTGRLLDEASTAGGIDPATGEICTPTEPWLAPVAEALTGRRLSIAAAEAIRSGLGTPNSAVTIGQLTTAAGELCDEAATLDPDRLRLRARQARDEFDAAGISIREEERRAARSARLIETPDGGGRLIWTMDPETFAAVKEVCDRATSPRRGGPRFVNADQKALAETIAGDPRSTEQYLSDAILELLRLGAGANPVFLLGSGAPVVRVTVTKTARDARAGHGRIEGLPDPISIETIERLACTGDTIEVGFAVDGQPLDVGREQRFYTRTQRIALAVRDGGCRWPGCGRPPSWTEAHHTKYWSRDRGKTDIADGILLCRHHHLLAHNNHWEIHHKGADYWLTPPPGIDPNQTPIPMPTKSLAMRDLQQERESAVAV